MRGKGVVFLVLAMALPPLHAQREAVRELTTETRKAKDKAEHKDPGQKGHRVSRDSQPPRGSSPSPAELQQRKLEEQRATQRKLEERDLQNERRMNQQRRENDPRLQRARERTTDDPPPVVKPHPVRPVEAERKSPQQQSLSDDGRRVRCSAHPVCRGGGYGGCRGVEQTYPGNLAVSRKDVVRQCVALNTPDSCGCVPQCSRVAQCSNF